MLSLSKNEGLRLSGTALLLQVASWCSDRTAHLLQLSTFCYWLRLKVCCCLQVTSWCSDRPAQPLHWRLADHGVTPIAAALLPVVTVPDYSCVAHTRGILVQ